MRHFNPSNECDVRGGGFETLFAAMAARKGYQVRASTSAEDRNGHYDFTLSHKHMPDRKYECKSRKKLNRSDAAPQDDWIMVEFRGIEGHAGWLYGKADYVAFEQETTVIVVPRLSLVRLAEQLVDHGRWVEWASEAEYCCYRRRDRPLEKVALIRNTDILELPETQVWPK